MDDPCLSGDPRLANPQACLTCRDLAASTLEEGESGGVLDSLVQGLQRTVVAVCGLCSGLIATLDRWSERARQRSALGRLSDEMLKDIGLSRADVHIETRKPFWRA